MEETKQTPEAATPEKPSLWKSGLQEVVWGLGILAFAVYYYFEITKLETEGGSLRMNRIFMFIYELGGKNVSCGIGVVIGIVVAGLGIKNLLEYFKSK